MTVRTPSKETSFSALSGWLILFGMLAFWAVYIPIGALAPIEMPNPWYITGLVVAAILSFVSLFGYFIVNPNMSRVLVLFGKYRGSVREQGFFWTNPFTLKHKISLKAHNLSSERVKVNDLAGNPIEIGAVLVWQVEDTAQAQFDVEDYFQYVDIQIETAVRQLAKSHPYDDGASDGDASVSSLRTDTEQVSIELETELQQRLNRAGIGVVEARISHLAYAPEIASAMLQRQQADAIIAARKKIVEGAVGMVEDALQQLGERGVVELDDERRVTLVGNLLVVLCSGAAPQPVLNTGSLYT
ncbi:MAG: SPFH domain-containing protein [Planctomycetota bacterium]|nr:SPFH domain-containing protein [Planctomycetota bacterium]